MGAGSSRSPLLASWKATAADNRLSMSLMTYGYSKTPGTGGFTFGSVIGTIAPWKRGEPLSFAPGRRFAPMAGVFASSAGFGYMNAALSQDGRGFLSISGKSFPMRWAMGPPLSWPIPARCRSQCSMTRTRKS